MTTRTSPLLSLPPELRIMIYDYAMATDGIGTFQQTPLLACAYQEARTHYFDHYTFHLRTVANYLNKTGDLRSTSIHPDSRRFLLYLGDERAVHIKTLVITREAQHHRATRKANHNVRAWEIRFRDGYRNYTTRDLGEFEGEDGGELRSQVQKPMLCWDRAPRVDVVLKRLVEAGEAGLTVKNLVCLMAMMCGLRRTHDEGEAEDGKDAVFKVSTFLAGWKPESWAAGRHWPATQ